MKPLAPVARRYARALYALAVDTQVTEAVRSDLASLRRSLHESPELAAFAGNYLVPHGLREKALSALFAGRVAPLTWRFVRFLESKRRLGLIDDMARAYEADEEARRGIVQGTVTAAIPLDAGRVQAVAQGASARTGKTVVLSSITDAAMLGGFRLQIGDTVYDYSLAARLRMARAALAKGQG